MKHDRPWTKLEERRAVQMRSEKHTIAAVARALGRTYGQVSMKLSRLGATKCRPRRRSRGGFLEAVRRACRPGRTDREVAKLLRTTPQEVFRVRKKLGIPAGVTLSEAARRPRFSYRVQRCFACNAPRPSRVGDGWVSRGVRQGGGSWSEVYCPSCFSRWGWPQIPEKVRA